MNFSKQQTTPHARIARTNSEEREAMRTTRKRIQREEPSSAELLELLAEAIEKVRDFRIQQCETNDRA